MSFLTMPPEINSLLIFSGAGSAPMLSAAAAWDGLAAELGSAADSFSVVTSGLGLAGPGVGGDGSGGGPVRGMVASGGWPGRGYGRTGASGGQCV
jgi:PPE-repeat protein